MSRTPRIHLIIAFSAIYLIWGSTYLGMRVAIETMPPLLMAGTRFLTAGAGLFIFLRLRGAPWPKPHQWRDNAIVGVFLLLGGNGLVVWSEQFLPSGTTALLIGVGPLFIALTEWAWPGGERPAAPTLAALVLGFLGVAWLAAPWEGSANGALPTGGVAAVLCACVFWAVGSIYTRHAKNPSDPFLASAQQMLVGGAALLLAAAVRGDFARLDPAAITSQSWTAFAYLTAVGSLVGFSTFVWLMKHSTPARVATYAYVNPVVAVLLGWLLLDEPVTGRTLAGAAIIVASVAIITTQKSREKLAAPPRQAVVAISTEARR